MTNENPAILTPEQKRQQRIDGFLSTEGIKFITPEAKASYQLRVQRFADAYTLREPDRVPVSLPVGILPLNLNGDTLRTAMYDYKVLVDAYKKFNTLYSEELEYFAGPFTTPGKVLDILDYKLYAWPGHGLSPDAPGFQFVENEYMKAEEYNDLIRDPSDFWFRTYLPRVFGAFEPFRRLSPVTDMVEIVSLTQLIPLGSTQVLDTLQKMIDTGREFQRLIEAVGPYSRLGPAMGFPVEPRGIFAKAPFDILGDTLRGTANVMMDMYRRPDKVLEACDKIADLTINSILRSPHTKDNLMVFYPLHKGADGWMSQKQFEIFYWPSLKKVLDAFIAEGLIQSLFAEGSFNKRLEYFTEFPKGALMILFDQTDIFKAKQVLGTKCCIRGNIPSALIVTASPAEVKAYCRKLIEVCGKGGGYVLAAGAIAEYPKLENLKAIMEAVKEYGVYKK